MKKIDNDFIVNQYRSGVTSYKDFTEEVGLWDSEKYFFEKYMQHEDKILDLGCGTGRTTFPLYDLGFRNIIGVDVTPEMIEAAQELSKRNDYGIDFNIGDATDLSFPDSEFDVVVFSFNGLMSIPGEARRVAATKEVHRVLRNGGLFIFTTHDRNEESGFLEFWKEERIRWSENQQNAMLHEFGDLITTSKNESKEIFIHIPDMTEVKSLLHDTGFEVIETFYRSDKFKENDRVLAKSGECRFWVAKKI